MIVHKRQDGDRAGTACSLSLTFDSNNLILNMASVVHSNQPDRLTQIFNGLKNRNPDVRAQAAEGLTRFVSCIFLNQKAFLLMSLA